MSTGKKVLFVTYPEFGHIIPTVKLARRLKDDGWCVKYLVRRRFREWVEELGFEAIVIGSDEDLNENEYPYIRSGLDVFYETVADWETYDLILSDFFASFYALRARQGGVNCVTYHTCADIEKIRTPPLKAFWNRRVWVPMAVFGYYQWFHSRKMRRYRPRLKGECRAMKPDPAEHVGEVKRLLAEQGLRVAVSSMFGLGVNAETIVLGPSELSQRNLSKDRYFGYCLEEASIGQNAGLGARREKGKSVFYCSLGSMGVRYIDSYSVFHNLIQLFRDLDLGTLIVQAGGCYDSLVEFESECVEIHRYTDQKRMLAACDYAIIHGGYGSLKECIALGVPMLVIPFFNDQFYNAGVVERRGLGTAVPSEDADYETLERALLRLTNDERIKKTVGSFYAEANDEEVFEAAYQAMLERIATRAVEGSDRVLAGTETQV